MPSYTYQCERCGVERDMVMSMREYAGNPPAPTCCGAAMARRITGAALVIGGGASYEGMRVRDPRDPQKFVDISTRTKHRAFMREHGLATMDDFGETWQRAERERKARLAGEDPTRKRDIAQAIAQLEARPRIKAVGN